MLDSITQYLRRLIDGSNVDADPLAPSSEDAGDPAPAIEDGSSDRSLRIPREFAGDALDAEAVSVIRRLSGAGHEAFLVGGCVRDLLFGLQPKDFDVVTSAHPPELKRLFRNCRIIGRRFRLAHIYYRDKIIEVATFRALAAQSSGSASSELLIRDDNQFGSADQDAVRRDFTINALFYDVDGHEIIDFVGGVYDAEHRIVRTIGDPQIRMREDPIRMLRAIRLAGRLGCRIDTA
ncbi:MAG: poly(A) polymerase, partial [Acidobacteriota bacterium]|nr:poly(A) polymerase [Acidobacteriota bacterium]